MVIFTAFDSESIVNLQQLKSSPVLKLDEEVS